MTEKIKEFSQAFRKSTKRKGWELSVRLTPKASQTKIGEVVVDSDGQPYLKVYVTAVPEDNKANKALIDLLAKTFKIPKSSLRIISGKTDRCKVVLFEENLLFQDDFKPLRNRKN